MCGRTACTLAPDEVCKACRFRDKGGKLRQPVWRDAPGGQQYHPSYNIAPAAHTPVLISSRHYPEELAGLAERVVQPMKWGLVPSWHKGDPYKLEYETNNCRAEGMLEKRTYKVPLQKGQRCVVLAEGFFEWKRGKGQKQPYFIYFPQSTYTKTEVKREAVKEEVKTEACGDDGHFVQVKTEVKEESKAEMTGIKTEVKEEVKKEDDDETPSGLANEETSEWDDEERNDWEGPRLLTMAGVFDVWHPSDGGAAMYSYSVITVDASPAISCIHHRMPAILRTDEEVDQWLNFGEVPLEKAAKLIRPVEDLQMHPVSSVVNNSRNQSPECIKPVDLEKPKVSGSGQLMMNWLGTGKKAQEPSPKKQKTGQ